MKDRIVLENVIKMFEPNIRAVNGVNLTIEKGTFQVIYGPRDCGKTTLLYLMNGIYRPSEGKISVFGSPLHENTERENAILRNKVIGTVHRIPYMIQEMTVLENVALPLRMRGIGKKEAEEKAMEVLSSIGLEAYQSYKEKQMNQFEKHLTSLACEMIKEPEVLLCDDVLSTLKERQRDVYMDLLRVLYHTCDLTVVYFSSESEEGLEADQYYKMSWGCIEQEVVK